MALQGAQLEVDEQVREVERRVAARRQVQVEQPDGPGVLEEDLLVVQVPVEHDQLRRAGGQARGRDGQAAPPVAGVEEAVLPRRLQPPVRAGRLRGAVVDHERRPGSLLVPGPDRLADLLDLHRQRLVGPVGLSQPLVQGLSGDRRERDQPGGVVGVQHPGHPDPVRVALGQRADHVPGPAGADHLHVLLGVETYDGTPVRAVRHELGPGPGHQPVQPRQPAIGAGVLHQQVAVGEHLDGAGSRTRPPGARRRAACRPAPRATDRHTARRGRPAPW